MKNPRELSHAALAELVAGVQRILWADGPDTPWDSDTIDEVAAILADNGLGPGGQGPEVDVAAASPGGGRRRRLEHYVTVNGELTREQSRHVGTLLGRSLDPYREGTTTYVLELDPDQEPDGLRGYLASQEVGFQYGVVFGYGRRGVKR